MTRAERDQLAAAVNGRLTGRAGPYSRRRMLQDVHALAAALAAAEAEALGSISPCCAGQAPTWQRRRCRIVRRESGGQSPAGEDLGSTEEVTPNDPGPPRLAKPGGRRMALPMPPDGWEPTQSTWKPPGCKCLVSNGRLLISVSCPVHMERPIGQVYPTDISPPKPWQCDRCAQGDHTAHNQDSACRNDAESGEACACPMRPGAAYLESPPPARDKPGGIRTPERGLHADGSECRDYSITADGFICCRHRRSEP